MAKVFFRGAAIAMCLAAASLAGCGGGNGDARLSGSWHGRLSLTYAGGGGSAGNLELSLDREEDYLAGWALWDPVAARQSVTGPIRGRIIDLRLHFRCLDPQFEIPTTVVTVINGRLSGNTLTFRDASGLACLHGEVPTEVTGGSGQVVLISNGQPL